MRVAFLDSLGRFAKTPAQVFEIRVFEGDDPDTFTTITAAQYQAMPRADQDALKYADSAYGLVDVLHKSNG